MTTPAMKDSDNSIAALVLAMRQLSDNTARMDRSMEALNQKMGEVRDRLTHIEAQGYDKKIEELTSVISALNSRIDVLEREKDKRDGVTGGLEWLSKVGGWVTAALIGAATVWAILKGNGAK